MRHGPLPPILAPLDSPERSSPAIRHGLGAGVNAEAPSMRRTACWIGPSSQPEGPRFALAAPSGASAPKAGAAAACAGQHRRGAASEPRPRAAGQAQLARPGPRRPAVFRVQRAGRTVGQTLGTG